jgi:hypothetical protein
MSVTYWRMTESAAVPAANPFTIPGTTRKYAVASGATIDVPDFDAAILASQGWIVLTKNVVTTANRPVNAPAGTRIFDSTLGTSVVSDGKGNWLDHAAGTSA